MSVCVAPGCSQPLHGKLEGPATVYEGPGRAETPIGPMHWRCYWALREQAYQEKIASLANSRAHVRLTAKQPNGATVRP